MADKTPWAVILCKWQGTTDEPKPISFFKRLFTTDGSGTSNMTDFFDRMSHGAVDLSESKVFGWYTLSLPQTAYAGNVDVAPAGMINRQGLVDLAKKTATDSKVDLSGFYGVVVCMNTLTDLFGGGGRQAVCDPGSFEPSVLGQEMGHGYGIAHSRRGGSTADYLDPWDVMSTWDSAYMARHLEYTLIGPGLNAANMRGRGWLDESRVWYDSALPTTEIVDIRPLHQRDLPGFLAADIAGFGGIRYLFELRLKTAWDAAIPRAAVLVHRFEDNRSYLMTSSKGAPDLVAGDLIEWGDEKIAAGPHLSVEVVSIDEAKQTARLRVRRRGAKIVTYSPIRAFDERVDVTMVPEGGGLVDGGGYVIIGGKIIRIPPWNPMFPILHEIAAFEAAALVSDTNVKTTVRQHVLQKLAALVESTMSRTPTFRTPAPRTASNTPPSGMDEPRNRPVGKSQPRRGRRPPRSS